MIIRRVWCFEKGIRATQRNAERPARSHTQPSQTKEVLHCAFRETLLGLRFGLGFRV